VLGAYSAAFEHIELTLEEFDIQAMRGDADEERDIERLIEMRREVGKLRRALAAHRGALVSLTHPELEALGDHASGERFKSLLSRFESTRGGHRTNEIMKVLTLTSVILPPGALIAGVMGMNFNVGFFDNPSLFWVVVGAIVAIGPVAIGLAKRWEWI
jgi:magnesium transporter